LICSRMMRLISSARMSIGGVFSSAEGGFS
jgi:hypothetical protein